MIPLRLLSNESVEISLSGRRHTIAMMPRVSLAVGVSDIESLGAYVRTQWQDYQEKLLGWGNNARRKNLLSAGVCYMLQHHNAGS